MKNVSWPQAVLALGTILLVLASAVILKGMGEDPSGVLNVVVLSLITLLGLLGWSNSSRTEMKVDQVKELSNGRLDTMHAQNQALMEANQQLQDKITELALRMPPPEEK